MAATTTVPSAGPISGSRSFLRKLREGDEITKGAAVTFEVEVDPKTGKTKAVSVDLL